MCKCYGTGFVLEYDPVLTLVIRERCTTCLPASMHGGEGSSTTRGGPSVLTLTRKWRKKHVDVQ